MSQSTITKLQFTVTSNHDPSQKKKKASKFNKEKSSNCFIYSPQSSQDNAPSFNQMTRQTMSNLNSNWFPKTELGKLVKSGKIRSIEDIFLRNMIISEEEIVNNLLNRSILKEEIFSIKPVEYQKSDGKLKKTFKVIAIVGDYNGHIGIGFKSSPEIADAIKEAKRMAKLSIIPVVRGSWKSNDRSLHTISAPVIGESDSVMMKIMPAPKGTGIIACSVAKKLLEMAGFKDVFTSTTGHAKSTYHYLAATYIALHDTFQIGTNLRRKNSNGRNNMQHLANAPNAKSISNKSVVQPINYSILTEEITL